MIQIKAARSPLLDKKIIHMRPAKYQCEEMKYGVLIVWSYKDVFLFVTRSIALFLLQDFMVIKYYRHLLRIIYSNFPDQTDTTNYVHKT